MANAAAERSHQAKKRGRRELRAAVGSGRGRSRRCHSKRHSPVHQLADGGVKNLASRQESTVYKSGRVADEMRFFWRKRGRAGG
jgi:hypothetical protein